MNAIGIVDDPSAFPALAPRMKDRKAVEKNLRSRILFAPLFMQFTKSYSRRSLLSAAGFISGSTVLGGAASAQVEAGATVKSSGSGSGESTGVLYQLPEGPWGRFSYYYFYLEAPAHLIEVFPLRNPRTRWAVPSDREAEFRQVLEGAALTPSERSSLGNQANTGLADGLFALFPTPEVLLSISPEARATIYQYLGRFEINPEIKDPVRIRSGSVDEWAKGTAIRPELVEQMKRMTYMRDGLMLFADFAHLISQAGSESEIRVLQRHSSRVRSMMLRIDLNAVDSIDEILAYWTTGLGLRRKEIEPVIRAAIETPGVTELDAVHLLPPLARKLLYTYPDMSMAIEGQLPDCHWTALNFFNYNPETIYLNEFFAASGLLSGFEQIEGPYRFGDVLVFVTPQMNAHHSCVYLAGDVVYTKNGRSLYAPWTVSHLSDVKALYPEVDGQPLRVQGFRKKSA